MQPGSILEKNEEKSVSIKVSEIRLHLQPSASYSDVQKRLSLVTGAPPGEILLLSDGKPMKECRNVSVAQLPKSSILSYQILPSPVTVMSLPLFTPLTLILVSTSSIRLFKEPIWVKIGSSFADLKEIIPRLAPDMRFGGKIAIQLSRGREEAIDRLAPDEEHPHKEMIRADLVHTTVLESLSLYKSYIKHGQTFGVEVRLSSAPDFSSFIGVSRIVSVTRTMTGRDLIKKISRINVMPPDPAGQFYFIVSEKPKVNMKIELDDVLHIVLNSFLKNLAKKRNRVAIVLLTQDPFINQRDTRIHRSLSAVINC